MSFPSDLLAWKKFKTFCIFSKMCLSLLFVALFLPMVLFVWVTLFDPRSLFVSLTGKLKVLKNLIKSYKCFVIVGLSLIIGVADGLVRLKADVSLVSWTTFRAGSWFGLLLELRGFSLEELLLLEFCGIFARSIMFVFLFSSTLSLPWVFPQLSCNLSVLVQFLSIFCSAAIEPTWVLL